MSDSAERYRKVAAQLTQRVEAVPDGAWDNPAPCEGWVARDVIRHLVAWLPDHFFGTWEVEHTPGPSVDDDPAAGVGRRRPVHPSRPRRPHDRR